MHERGIHDAEVLLRLLGSWYLGAKGTDGDMRGG